MSLFTSILTGGDNSHETTAEEVNALATDFVSEGVVGAVANTGGVAPATGGFAVNAQGSPAMAVDVTAGVAYVTATPTGGSSQTLRVKSTATEAVTIAANSTGSTRYDWLYIKIDPDKAANPAVDASDVASLVVSRSTSNTSDNGNPPTYGYPVAVVTVANGATSITNANITDKRELATSVQDNSITAAKLNLSPQSALQTASGTTTSTSFTNTLSGSPGTNPSVTVNISANGIALVSIKGLVQQSTNSTSLMGFAVSGANTIAASDDYAIGVNPAVIIRMGATFILTGLTPGSTTFTLQYRVSGGTGTFSHRYISVLPL